MAETMVEKKAETTVVSKAAERVEKKVVSMADSSDYLHKGEAHRWGTIAFLADMQCKNSFDYLQSTYL